MQSGASANSAHVVITEESTGGESWHARTAKAGDGSPCMSPVGARQADLRG